MKIIHNNTGSGLEVVKPLEVAQSNLKPIESNNKPLEPIESNEKAIKEFKANSILGPKLGDMIKTLSYYEKHHKETRIILPERIRTGNIKQRLAELMSILVLHNDYTTIDAHSDRVEHRLSLYDNGAYPHTKIPYVGGDIITYQLDGGSRGDKKNTDQELINRWINQNIGTKCIEIGGHLSLLECVKLLSISKYFVGIDSGMAHLAHCVRTPCYVVLNNMRQKDVKVWHYRAENCEYVQRLDDIINRNNRSWKNGVTPKSLVCGSGNYMKELLDKNAIDFTKYDEIYCINTVSHIVKYPHVWCVSTDFFKFNKFLPEVAFRKLNAPWVKYEIKYYTKTPKWYKGNSTMFLDTVYHIANTYPNNVEIECIGCDLDYSSKNTHFYPGGKPDPIRKIVPQRVV